MRKGCMLRNVFFSGDLFSAISFNVRERRDVIFGQRLNVFIKKQV